MIQLSQNITLINKLIHIFQWGFFDHFYSHLLESESVSRQINYSKAAVADVFVEVVHFLDVAKLWVDENFLVDIQVLGNPPFDMNLIQFKTSFFTFYWR